MKPSEFLSKKGLITNIEDFRKDNNIKEYNKLGDLNKLIIDEFHKKLFKDYEELDAHFINKEELKDKINKKLNEKIKIWGESQPEVTIADEIYQEAEHKVYKEILEMLK